MADEDLSTPRLIANFMAASTAVEKYLQQGWPLTDLELQSRQCRCLTQGRFFVLCAYRDNSIQEIIHHKWDHEWDDRLKELVNLHTVLIIGMILKGPIALKSEEVL